MTAPAQPTLSYRRIAKLEVQVTEANRELAKIEELQKTLDMMRISSGSVSANSKGDITSRVHALVCLLTLSPAETYIFKKNIT